MCTLYGRAVANTATTTDVYRGYAGTCGRADGRTGHLDYGEKRKLIFYKEGGKKTKVGSVTGTWCASWEPYNHTKRGPGAGPPDATA